MGRIQRRIPCCGCRDARNAQSYGKATLLSLSGWWSWCGLTDVFCVAYDVWRLRRTAWQVSWICRNSITTDGVSPRHIKTPTCSSVPSRPYRRPERKTDPTSVQKIWSSSSVQMMPKTMVQRLDTLWCFLTPTHRPLSSSFSGLPYRILTIIHKKELLRGLWVPLRPKSLGHGEVGVGPGLVGTLCFPRYFKVN